MRLVSLYLGLILHNTVDEDTNVLHPAMSPTTEVGQMYLKLVGQMYLKVVGQMYLKLVGQILSTALKYLTGSMPCFGLSYCFKACCVLAAFASTTVFEKCGEVGSKGAS